MSDLKLTEDIKVENGHIIVERAEWKQDVDVAVSDVESVSFTSSGVGGGAGALVLHTKNGDEVIRVENDDAGKALKIVYGALDKSTKDSTPKQAQKPAVSEEK